MKKILIIGCGYAGAVAAWKLSALRKRFSVTVLDRQEFFNFLPLLPDAVGRKIPPDCMRYPIHKVASAYGAAFVKAEVLSLDLLAQKISTANGIFEYDYLIVACGSETNFYGNEELRKNSFKLDDVQDAKRLVQALEGQGFKNFVIAGGGYTGIEIATNLSAFLRNNKKQGTIFVVERAPGILGPMPEWARNYVSGNLSRLGISVLANSVIENVDGGLIKLAGGRDIENALLIWAAGVKTPDFLQKLSVEKNPQGRVKVDAYLRLNDRCFFAGDAALFTWAAAPLRMAVQFAIAEGGLAALNVLRSIAGKPLKPYKPFDFGYLIPMANKRACGVVLGMDMKGRIPVLLHYMLSLYRTVGLKNKWGVIKALIRGGA